MGHIRKRTTAAGGTRYQARLPNPRQPRRDVMRTFRTRREAEGWLRAQAAAIDQGSWVDHRQARMPLAQVVEGWRATWQLEPKTRQGYASILARHVLPQWGTVPVGHIDTAAVQEWLNDLATTLQPNTVRRVYSVLSAVLAHAVATRLIGVNPAQAVKLPRKAAQAQPQPLTHAELDQLVGALPAHWQLPVLLTAYTGLRAGELWGLTREAVDLTGPTPSLHVQQALKEVGTEAGATAPTAQRLAPSLVLGPTKTHQARTVALPAFLVPSLKQHLASQPINPDALVFTTPNGHPVRHGQFYRRVFRKAAATALPHHPTPVTFHTLRHTHASMLIQQGAPITLVSRRLGHASTRMTLDTYSHMYPSEEAALAAQLDKARQAAQAQHAPAPAPAPADLEASRTTHAKKLG